MTTPCQIHGPNWTPGPGEWCPACRPGRRPFDEITEQQAQTEAEQRAEAEAADRLDHYDPTEPWTEVPF